MPGDFKQQLLAAGKVPEIIHHPFVRGIAEGSYPKGALHFYAQELIALAASFPAQLATLFARCDNENARRVILQNLLEEEGVISFGTSASLVIDPPKRHAALGERFLKALGIDNLTTPPPTGQWLTNELNAGRWLGPFTYFSVGMEANVPVTFRLLYEGLRTHYGLCDEDLEYFIEHFIADERHAEHGAAVAAAAATTEALRAEAITGAQRGGQAWWHFHQQHARRLRNHLTARA